MKIIRPLTPLRQRMLENLQIRNDSPHTIDGSLRYVAHAPSTSAPRLTASAPARGAKADATPGARPPG
jgi:hypothetical protein